MAPALTPAMQWTGMSFCSKTLRARRCAPCRGRNLRPAPVRGAWERERLSATRSTGGRGRRRQPDIQLPQAIFKALSCPRSGWTTIILDVHSFRQVPSRYSFACFSLRPHSRRPLFRHAGHRAIAREAHRAGQRADDRRASRRREYRDSGLFRARPPHAYGLPIAHARRRRPEPDRSRAGRPAGPDSLPRIAGGAPDRRRRTVLHPRHRFRIFQNAGRDARQMGSRPDPFRRGVGDSPVSSGRDHPALLGHAEGRPRAAPGLRDPGQRGVFRRPPIPAAFRNN